VIDCGRRTAGPQNERAAMAEVEIYTTPFCPYCWRAKSLLKKKGIAFAEIDLWQHPERRAEMVLRAGGRPRYRRSSSMVARSAGRTS
jgi:glutaredoxin